MDAMRNFRRFECGPDPFGRTWKVEFKWLQTAISLRHADTVDVKFVLRDGDTRVQKTIALPHVDLLQLSKRTGQPLTDAWCSRLAALHLKRIIETGEDMEKDLVTISAEALGEYDTQLQSAVVTAA